jgi:hypothetical protein
MPTIAKKTLGNKKTHNKYKKKYNKELHKANDEKYRQQSPRHLKDRGLVSAPSTTYGAQAAQPL